MDWLLGAPVLGEGEGTRVRGQGCALAGLGWLGWAGCAVLAGLGWAAAGWA